MNSSNNLLARENLLKIYSEFYELWTDHNKSEKGFIQILIREIEDRIPKNLNIGQIIITPGSIGEKVGRLPRLGDDGYVGVKLSTG